MNGPFSSVLSEQSNIINQNNIIINQAIDLDAQDGEQEQEQEIVKVKPQTLIEKSSKNLRLIKDLKTTFKKDIGQMNDVIYNHDLMQDSEVQSYVIPRPKSSQSHNSRPASHIEYINVDSVDECNTNTYRSVSSNMQANNNFYNNDRNT